MLTALTEPGYRDDMDKCNKDDSGGMGTRFYFLVFRNQIPSFFIFKNQILTAGKNPNMNAILRAWDPSYKMSFKYQ